MSVCLSICLFVCLYNGSPKSSTVLYEVYAVRNNHINLKLQARPMVMMHACCNRCMMPCVFRGRRRRSIAYSGASALPIYEDSKCNSFSLRSIMLEVSMLHSQSLCTFSMLLLFFLTPFRTAGKKTLYAGIIYFTIYFLHTFLSDCLKSVPIDRKT